MAYLGCCMIFCVLLVTTYGFVFPVNDTDDYKPFFENKHDYFDWKFFKAVANSNEKIGKNVVVSPFSVKLLLSILSEAAGPKARDQLSSNVLPLLQPGIPTRAYYEKILNSLAKKNEKYEFNSASKIYVDTNLTPTEKFLQIAVKHYKTSTEKVTFSDGLKTAELINNWCSKETSEHIKDLVKPDDMVDLVAVLVNAIYFKGTWEKIFPDQYSEPMIFEVTPNKRVKPIFMHNSAEFFYAETNELGPEVQILRLPYKGGRFAMTLILPTKRFGLDEVIEAIKPGKIQIIQNYLKKQRVVMYIPKFKFDSTSHLNDIIKSLGISEIFDGDSPLPDFGDKNIQISKIIQKAGVVVDEKGTEIFAVTDIEVSNRMGGTPYFQADHPFLFFIEDETTGALVFAGKVVDPTVD